MKKNFLVLIIGFVLILLAVCIFSSGCVSNDTDKKTYVVGLDPALQPFSVKSINTGEPEGFDVEMLDWIAKDQGINFEYEFASYAQYLKVLDDGVYDLKPGLATTVSNSDRLIFTEPYLELHYSVIARKNSDLTIDDVLLGTTKIAIAADSSYLNWLKNYFGNERYNELVDAKIILVKESVDKAVYAVLTGEAEVTICSDVATVTQTENFPVLHFIGNLDGVIYLRICFPPTETELQKKLNASIANFRASSEYNILNEKYKIPYMKDTYKVGVDYYNVPFTYLDDDGKLTGLDYDSIKWIADKYGFDLEFTELDWARNINAVARGEIDMWYSGMTITEERSNKVTFSDPYMTSGTAVLCRNSDQITKSMFESGEVVIGSMLGTTNSEWLEEFFGDTYDSMISSGKIMLIPDQDEMFDKLADKTVDCVVVDEFGSNIVVAEKNLKTITVYEGGSGDYGVAIKNGDIVLQGILNEGIAEMKANGKYAELLEKYNLN